MNYFFKNNSEIIDISGKRYLNVGISKSKLCKQLGIEKKIIDVYDNWYLIDGKFYYYKNEYIFQELLISELSKEIGVKCVDFRLVKRSGRLGIISEFYRSLEKEYYMYNDFCLKNFNSKVFNLIDFKKLSNETFGSENTCNLMNDLYGMLVMDLLSGQVDRGEYNFFFECGDKVRLAPLCDNGACLFKNKVIEFPFGNYNLFSDKNNDMYSLLKSDIDFYFKLESVLDIDISCVLERVIEKYDVIIDNEFNSFILDYFDLNKMMISKSLKLSKRK